MQKMPGDRIVSQITHDLSHRYRLLCLDEFQVIDIADAMLLRSLLASLMAAPQLTMMFTSNRAPGDLYKNGIQRESFVPCIRAIEERMLVMRLESGRDYRLKENYSGALATYIWYREIYKRLTYCVVLLIG